MCQANHDGTSGSMEPKAMLEMCLRLHLECFVCCKHIISDDESSIKARLKWSNDAHEQNRGHPPTHINDKGVETTRPTTGGIPANVPEPTFLADPNHRKKTLRNALYEVINTRKVSARGGLTECDVIWVTTNFAYMARLLKDKPVDAFEQSGKAVVEHHFDNHEFCGAFCKRKDQSAEEQQQSKKLYRCKDKDAKLHELLQSLVACFITLDKLKEIAVGDTQLNESLNNSISWLAPKNKTCSTTKSLSNRVAIAIGINSVGMVAFFSRLFALLQMQVSFSVEHYLHLQEKTRQCRIAKSKMHYAKSYRPFELFVNENYKL